MVGKRVYGPAVRKAPAKKAAKKRPSVRAIRSIANTGILRSNPLKNVLNAELRVAAGGNINAGAGGVIATQTYKINSLFSHQPTGFDQLAVLYAKYRVETVKLDFKVAAGSYAGGQSGTNCGAFVFGIMVTDSATAPTGFRQPMENGMTSFDIMPVGTSIKGSVSIYVNVPDLLVRDKRDDELSALVTADPAKILYAHVFIQAVDAAIDLSSIGYVFLMETKASFLEPVNVAASS